MRNNAKMIGIGKTNANDSRLRINVFFTNVQAMLVEKNCLKYLSPTQGLSRIPLRMLKSLKASVRPYMGVYRKTKSHSSAGKSKT